MKTGGLPLKSGECFMKTGVNHSIMMKGNYIDFTYIDLQNVPVFIEHSLDCHKNVPVFMEIGIRVLRFSCVFAHCHAPHPIISRQFAGRCSGFHVFWHIAMRRVLVFPYNLVSDAVAFMCSHTCGCTVTNHVHRRCGSGR